MPRSAPDLRLLTGFHVRAAGNQSEAARLLGLSRDTLRQRLEKFALFPPKP